MHFNKFIIFFVCIGFVLSHKVVNADTEKEARAFELYSFTIDQKITDLYFALLPQTEHISFSALLIEKKSTYQEILNQIRQLPKNADIFWMHKFSNSAESDSSISTAYPPMAIVEDIISLCKSLKVNLHNTDLLFLEPH